MDNQYFADSFERIRQYYPEKKEYLSAVAEILENVQVASELLSQMEKFNVLERLFIPDQVIEFNVTWLDDANKVQNNKGWRVQHANLIGPYKGGLRFHSTVTPSVLQFLALEQSFKNALTGFAIGGAKGGSNFDPKGKSDAEVMRFCQSFMNELIHYIGPHQDVPAGDINVGTREIGFLFGQYRKLTQNFVGSITGKSVDFGGSPIREEATGYGVVYFLDEMMKFADSDINQQRVAISGAGNVALHTALKAVELGAKVVSLSNSRGSLLCEKGFTLDALNIIKKLKEQHVDNALTECELAGCDWLSSEKPWSIAHTVAIPCATQLEVESDDVEVMANAGCQWLIEGANMPCTPSALTALHDASITYAPAKAVNAGGVVASVFEMGMNARFSSPQFANNQECLKMVMKDIHDKCVKWGKTNKSDSVDYQCGANSYALQKLATVMLTQGV
ncbi:NADP-specific glutamate dehydrogenase [Thalassotalea sp. G2M2-11]|uniref:NADP-specific glutamate dehydrogenase n=1 Tax=Thalassotalea sp. G2M2-11 TaxID=2787627 RepID=UPI0019D31FB6|nr:NADP-specific glutamate dehydrogenase [Thalassotalea sp. G2M2-11]